ncbi:hypothetical protein RSAG8_07975, partial [Rhizoctonia solani AG-8 WAC10335]
MSTLVEITDLIESATQDLELGQVLFMPNFSLFDAMSAIEIMDPRMDSALVPPSVDPPEVPFTDPNAPLLAEEVCWILDRTMAAEMGWHSGYALSQTLYTSLYIHQITPVSNHGALPQYFPAWRHDPARPMALVTIVLQAGLMAIVKTCDWVWRELSKGNVFDLEDFNADKADVSLFEGLQMADISLFEGLQVQTVIAELDKALTCSLSILTRIWPHSVEVFSSPSNSSSKAGLGDSIADRAMHVSNALASYHSIRAGPVPGTPPPSSPLHAAFDPTINRRLVVIELMPVNDAWKALQGMLQGVLEICKALDSVDLLDMMMLLRLRARLPLSPSRSAYVRSLNASLLRSKLAPSSRRQIGEQPEYPERPVFQLFLSQLLGLSLEDIRAVHVWPLDNVIDLMFAGFETQLYGEAEWPLLYWHLARVLTQQVHSIGKTLLRLLQEDEEVLPPRTLDYIRSQIIYAKSLRSLSQGTLLALFVRPPKHLDTSTLSKLPTTDGMLCIERRFKWAFGSHSRSTKYLDETKPNLESWVQFASKTQACQSDEIIQEALKEFKEAVHLLSLLDKSIWKATGGSCDQLMQAFLTGCVKVCNTQVSVLDKASDRDIDSGKDDPSKWSFEQSPWFPAVSYL